MSLPTVAQMAALLQRHPDEIRVSAVGRTGLVFRLERRETITVTQLVAVQTAFPEYSIGIDACDYGLDITIELPDVQPTLGAVVLASQRRQTWTSVGEEPPNLTGYGEDGNGGSDW